MSKRPSTATRPPVEFHDHSIEDMMDCMIGEDYLRRVCGASDLTEVESISLVVDSSSQSIHSIGDFLPNAIRLTLDNSRISSIRDLGVGLKRLLTLSLNDCGLGDLDGIGVLIHLQDLSLVNNQISDVVPIAMHDHLEV